LVFFGVFSGARGARGTALGRLLRVVDSARERVAPVRGAIDGAEGDEATWLGVSVTSGATSRPVTDADASSEELTVSACAGAKDAAAPAVGDSVVGVAGVVEAISSEGTRLGGFA
jgi:hypothetical protein